MWKLGVDLVVSALLPAYVFLIDPPECAQLKAIEYSCNNTLTPAGAAIGVVHTLGMAMFGAGCIAALRVLANGTRH